MDIAEVPLRAAQAGRRKKTLSEPDRLGERPGKISCLSSGIVMRIRQPVQVRWPLMPFEADLSPELYGYGCRSLREIFPCRRNFIREPVYLCRNSIAVFICFISPFVVGPNWTSQFRLALHTGYVALFCASVPRCACPPLYAGRQERCPGEAYLLFNGHPESQASPHDAHRARRRSYHLPLASLRGASSRTVGLAADLTFFTGSIAVTGSPIVLGQDSVKKSAK